jgi:hypothetical protein
MIGKIHDKTFPEIFVWWSASQCTAALKLIVQTCGEDDYHFPILISIRAPVE